MHAWENLHIELDKYRIRDVDRWHLQFSATDLHGDAAGTRLYACGGWSRNVAANRWPALTRPRGPRCSPPGRPYSLRMEELYAHQVRFAAAAGSKAMHLLHDLSKAAAIPPPVWY